MKAILFGLVATLLLASVPPPAQAFHPGSGHAVAGARPVNFSRGYGYGNFNSFYRGYGYGNFGGYGLGSYGLGSYGLGAYAVPSLGYSVGGCGMAQPPVNFALPPLAPSSTTTTTTVITTTSP